MKLIRVAQAEAVSGFSHNTLRRYGDCGLVHCEKTPGGHRLFDLNDLLTLREKLSRTERAGKKFGRRLAFLSQGRAR
ncbi:MAG: MerR family transcriptional regulator [Syntrophales bacterium]|jgi:DNA-binding transcriptional MerR regulator